MVLRGFSLSIQVKTTDKLKFVKTRENLGKTNRGQNQRC